MRYLPRKLDMVVRQAARHFPAVVISGPRRSGELRPPVLFDEIQNAPELLSYVRTRVDAAPGRMGQWLFTGETVHPAMAAPLLSLRRRLEKRSIRLIIVHAKSRSAPATSAVARGVEAIDLQRFVADLTDGHQK